MIQQLSRKALEFAAERVRRVEWWSFLRQQKELLEMAQSSFFTPRDDDIYIASYPKSGTTLMQMMLNQLTGDGAVDFVHIEAVSPFYEMAVLVDAERLEALPSPRVFKTHRTPDFLPSRGRFLYLARQVRDVALSCYHHRCLVEGIDLNLADFLDQFIAGKSNFGPWGEHIAAWWPLRNQDNVLFLLFEDIIADLEGTARQVRDFCNLYAGEDQIVRTAERTSLAFMKQHNHRFDTRVRRTCNTPPPNLLEFLPPGVGAHTFDDAQRQRYAQQLETIGATSLMPLASSGNPNREGA